jgi:hypothetical protein
MAETSSINLTKIVICDGCVGGDPTYATYYVVDPEVSKLCELQYMSDNHTHSVEEFCKFIELNFEVAHIEREVSFYV